MGLLQLFVLAYLLICLLGTARLVYLVWYPPRKTYARALARGDATDPADLELESESVQFSFRGGVTSPGWLLPGLDEAGPAIVIIHGYGDSRYGALRCVKLLQSYASELVVFDLRGHGESSKSYSTAGVVESEDILTLLDQFDAPHGVVLYGYSMGGRIAIAAAAMAEEELSRRIKGVIADGPYRTWYEPVRHIIKLRRYPTQPFILLARLVLYLFNRRSEHDDTRDHAVKLQCPLLVLHGSDDLICPLDSARQIAEAAKAGKLVVFEGGGHLDLLELDEIRYKGEIAAFFSEKVVQANEYCESD